MAATTNLVDPRGGRPDRAAAARTEQLYARHHRLVLGLCRGLLRDPAEAEDAAQQVFLSAHRSLLNGATPREPAAWLATIARNECWARISARLRDPLPTERADTVAAGVDPLAEAIRSADLAAVWGAIRELPRAQRDALLLREFGGLRYDELAVALAVTEPAVESLLVRARSRLRARLETVYASLAPALRFLVSSGTPAIAAKAAALGLGAAAVTGGLAPEMLTRHHMQPPAKRIAHRAPPATIARAAPIVVEPPLAPAPAAPTATVVKAAVPAAPPESERERSDQSNREQISSLPGYTSVQVVQPQDGSADAPVARKSGDSGSSDDSSDSGGGD